VTAAEHERAGAKERGGEREPSMRRNERRDAECDRQHDEGGQRERGAAAADRAVAVDCDRSRVAARERAGERAAPIAATPVQAPSNAISAPATPIANAAWA
jgi:hypothetical protein